MIRAAIFDLDGTLADTMPALGEAMNMALAHYGFPAKNREDLLLCINYGSREFVRKAFPEDFPEDMLDEALAFYEDCYTQVWQKTDTLYPNIRELCDKLKALGFKLGVITNKMHYITVPLIEQLFGKGYFDDVIGQGEFPTKPDPISTLVMLSRFGIEQNEAAFIGDSHIDMRTAKNSGLTAIGVSWGYRSEEDLWREGADCVAHDCDELFEFITAND